MVGFGRSAECDMPGRRSVRVLHLDQSIAKGRDRLPRKWVREVDEPFHHGRFGTGPDGTRISAGDYDIGVYAMHEDFFGTNLVSSSGGFRRREKRRRSVEG